LAGRRFHPINNSLKDTGFWGFGDAGVKEEDQIVEGDVGGISH